MMMVSKAVTARDKLNYAMDKLVRDRLFVPPELDMEIDGSRYASTLLLSFANLAIDHSKMLLYGGKGTGKTTLAKWIGDIACGRWRDESYSPLLCDQEMTRSQVQGRIDPLEYKKGRLEVKWSDFVTHPFKIIDEVNRMSSRAFSYFMSILGNHTVSLYGNHKELGAYRVYATLNPPDEGTSPIPPPSMDRFGVMVPFSKLPSNELNKVLRRPDEEQGAKEHIENVMEELKKRGGLTSDEFYHLPSYAKNSVKVPEEVDKNISLLISDFNFCERADNNDKDLLRETRPPNICKNCKWYKNQNKKKYICHATSVALSVRPAQDLRRYSVAVAYLLGKPEVDMDIVESVAPFALAHRINPVGELYRKKYNNSRLYEYTKDIIRRSFETTSKDRKKFIKLRDDALASNKISDIDSAFNELESNFHDPMKYDFMKSLENKKNRLRKP